MKLHLTPAPHVHSPQTTRALMRNVLLALAPCAVAGVVIFGAPALVLMAVSVLSAVAGEACWQRLTGQKVRVDDLSAAVTGLILGMNLSPRAPWWLAVVGGLFAVVLVKGLFGGLGDNFLNPALAARAFLLVSWPRYLTTWAAPMAADAVSGATPLANPSGYTLGQLFLGNIPGCIGEGSTLAILIGGMVLIRMGIASWRVVFSGILGVVITASIFNAIGSNTNAMFGLNPVWHLVLGGFAFGIFFMATDPVSSAFTKTGKWLYGFLIGAMVVLVRVVNPAYPEGVMLAILFANCWAPLFDYFVTQRNINKRLKLVAVKGGR